MRRSGPRPRRAARRTAGRRSGPRPGRRCRSRSTPGRSHGAGKSRPSQLFRIDDSAVRLSQRCIKSSAGHFPPEHSRPPWPGGMGATSEESITMLNSVQQADRFAYVLSDLFSGASLPGGCRSTMGLGFIYCVSLTGVTGARRDLWDGLPDFLDRVRASPICRWWLGLGSAARRMSGRLARTPMARSSPAR